MPLSTREIESLSGRLIIFKHIYFRSLLLINNFEYALLS
jgi:hypothetical protein